MELHVFQGGWNINEDDRLATSQRPADGHIKPDGYEDHIILMQDTLGCSKLEVGDVIALHTTPTLGYVLGYGFAVEVPADGLKLKLVSLREDTNLSKIKAMKSTYDGDKETFVSEEADLTTLEFGDEVMWVGGLTEKNTDLFIANTDLIGFEVVSMPESGTLEDVRIVSRLHFTQPVRPPAYLDCCGSYGVNYASTSDDDSDNG